MKKKLKRIAAMAAVILLAGLFIAAVVLAVAGAPMEYLMAVMFSIVFISALFYAMQLMVKALKGANRKDPSPDKKKSEDEKG